jgi:hypothetical protein
MTIKAHCGSFDENVADWLCKSRMTLMETIQRQYLRHDIPQVRKSVGLPTIAQR